MSESDARTEDARKETARRWNELLQELRVAQTGIQLLTGFLLTLPFSQRFAELQRTERISYLTVLSSSILSAGLLIAPVAFHRVLFRRGGKPWLIGAAHRSARAGLVLLGVTMAGVAFLVFDVVVDLVAGIVAGSTTALVLLGLWLVVPLVGGEQQEEPSAGTA